MTTNESNVDNEDFPYQDRIEQNSNIKLLFEERVRIIKELPSNAIHDEVEEIYLKYKQTNKLNEDGDYVESSKLVNSEIKVEVRNGTINCYYFDGQYVSGHGAILEEVPFVSDSEPLRYSSLTYSGNMVNDPSPTQVRSI